MFATLTASALLLAAQAASPAPIAEPERTAQPETARAEPAAGASETSAGDKPPVLIDLGTGDAAEDPAERAERAFHSASAGRAGYRIALADGSMADVRSAARRGLKTPRAPSPGHARPLTQPAKRAAGASADGPEGCPQVNPRR